MNGLKIAIMVVLFLTRVVYAINPVLGPYAGLIVGGSKQPTVDFNSLNSSNFQSGQGQLTYSVLGGLGGQVGYRFNQFRVEGELFYNYSPYKHLEIAGLNIPNAADTSTSQTMPFTFSGYTSTYALTLNGMYDFYITQYTEHLVPYVGLGVGFGQVKNSFLLSNDGSGALSGLASAVGFVQYKNNLVGQGIVGLSYFFTDYTVFSFDYRYLSSLETNLAGNTVVSLQNRPQIYSVNFVFNSAFNLA